MNREREGANRPDDDRSAGDPDTADGPSTPGGWTPWIGGWGFDWLPGARAGDERTGASVGDDSGRLLALAILVGVALFLFPEPVTSVVGLALVVVGALGLLIRLSRRRSA